MVLAPAGDAALDEIAERRAEDAREIDAPVLLEVLVLDGGDGVVENPGALLPGHQDAALQGEAADELAVIGVDFGDDVGTIGFQGADFREVAGVNEEQAASGAERDRAQEEKGERDAVNQFPAAEAQRDRGQAQH